jgi:molecular chaperone GrpE
MSEEQRIDAVNSDNSSTASDTEKVLSELKAKAEVNLAGWQRAQADYANYKKRSEQEKEEVVKYANAALVRIILPILDDFERAVGSLPGDLKGHSWIDGIKLIERKFRSTLESQGLTPIKALGEPFDPRFHDAVRQEKGPEGIVVAEAVKGYKFLDRVIRPSQVAVGMGEPAAGNENEKNDRAI